MTRSRFVVLLLAGLAVAGGLWRYFDSHREPNPAAQAAAGVPVEVGKARRTDLPIPVVGLGTVQAYNTVTLTPRVDGQIDKVAFVEGQFVHRGDLLVQIDPRPYQAQLDSAVGTLERDRAQLHNAELDLNRYRMLVQQDSIPRQQLDTQAALVEQLKGQVKADEAAIDSAKTQLAYTTIVSPIEGRTGIRQIDQGNIVHASQTAGIVTITQLNPISVIFTLPEDILPTLARTMNAGSTPATVYSRDMKTELDRGTVALIDNQIDQTTGMVRLKANFPNDAHRLWPGAFVNVQIVKEVERNVLVVPSLAVQRGPAGLFCYVVLPNDTVELRPVKIGEDTGSAAVVLSGLEEGDTVVTAGHYRLQPGARVEVRDSNEPVASGGVGPGAAAAQ